MRYVATAILFLLLAGGIYFYNTNWFQSTSKDDFYDDICHVPFDVTKKGEKIAIPLKYKYNTCYSIAISVPDKNVFHNHIVGPGVLNYRFISNGRVLAEGCTPDHNKYRISFYQDISSIHILVFNLPFPGAGDDLTLELDVLEPMAFLNPYIGNIYCRIKPAYSTKFSLCYDKGLMIPQQAAGN